LDLVRIAAFGVGALLGLLGFSRALRWLLDRHRGPTLATLTGFLVGSLNALWPWKEHVRELYRHGDGRIEWLETNALPATAGEVWIPLGLAIAGALVVTGLDRLGRTHGPGSADPSAAAAAS
ncbi:MAG: DUF368 domain-containing protein, partial [Gemmatimonadetes bacterium]|nr:DUF368 domain-containing protein [Gemmatimonadota bacterium]